MDSLLFPESSFPTAEQCATLMTARRNGAGQRSRVEVGRANEVDSVERVYYNRGNRVARVNCRTSGYSFVGRDGRISSRSEGSTRTRKRRMTEGDLDNDRERERRNET